MSSKIMDRTARPGMRYAFAAALEFLLIGSDCLELSESAAFSLCLDFL